MQESIFLRGNFENRGIGCYLWEVVKNRCNANHPAKIEALENKIGSAIDQIELHKVKRTIQN